MPNIEIKSVLKNYETAKKICNDLFEKGHLVEIQTDTYFTVAKGLLKYREIESSNGNKCYLIPYIREIQREPKESSYTFLIPIDNTLAKQLLSDILGIQITVKKTREIYFYENVRIHLDSVEHLGNFIEFEVVYRETDDKQTEKEKVKYLMKLFSIQEEDLIKNSYYDILKDMITVN